jgi:hypothetical protein
MLRGMQRARRVGVPLGAFALILLSLRLGACTVHDPEVDRVGDELPVPASDCYDGGCALPAPNALGAQIPCDVDDILGHPLPDGGYSAQAKCRRCHQDPPLNGAPFPLLTWADTQFCYSQRAVWQRMSNVIDSGYMPYCAGSDAGACAKFDPPVEPLTAVEKAKLLSWLDCPTPIFDTDCP